MNQQSANRRWVKVIKYILGALLCLAIGAGASLYYHLKLKPTTNSSDAAASVDSSTTDAGAATNPNSNAPTTVSGPNLNDALKSVDSSLSGADTSAANASAAPADSDPTP